MRWVMSSAIFMPRPLSRRGPNGPNVRRSPTVSGVSNCYLQVAPPRAAGRQRDGLLAGFEPGERGLLWMFASIHGDLPALDIPSIDGRRSDPSAGFGVA